MKKEIVIIWNGHSVVGDIRAKNGKVLTGYITGGIFSNSKFESHTTTSVRLVVTVEAFEAENGYEPVIVIVHANENSFSFLLRDVTKEFPIIVPEYEVAVTLSDDQRSLDEICHWNQKRNLKTNFQDIDSQDEESFEKAAQITRSLKCPIWLGIGRNVRLFETDFREAGKNDSFVALDWVRPIFNRGEVVLIEETQMLPYYFGFLIGRGWGCSDTIKRGIDSNCFPIFCGDIVDDDIHYASTSFVTLEKQPLLQENIKGTHYLIADKYTYGVNFSSEEQKQLDVLLAEEMNNDEETVFCMQVKAVNTGSVPRYAFMKTAYPVGPGAMNYLFNGDNGFSTYTSSNKVCCVSKCDNEPLRQEEIAILLSPGQFCTFEFFIPHCPISVKRAIELSNRSFDVMLAECRNYWNTKLNKAGQIDIPEKRVRDMANAGLLHLDLSTYGCEPEGNLAATVGRYGPIGSESAPILQYMDSVGWHDEARRILMYFVDKQRENGSIQNYCNYMLETGCVLWSIGEHYRYTRDSKWIQAISEKLIKACEYLIEWRRRNIKEELRGMGYGMLEGQIADPDDNERIYMLNGYAYLGLSRTAEVLKHINPAKSAYLQAEAEELKADIRTSFYESVGKGILMPLGDGTWCPTISPWAGDYGAKCLLIDGKKWYTHGAVTLRDLAGPLYLVFQEILQKDELAVKYMLNFLNELTHSRNVAFSQPYYSQHLLVHLKRGEVKQFLKGYYNSFSGLADRETYSFWEHYFHVSPHKTHEEAWFLMQTRWMLYIEDGDTLRILSGVPRKWLEDGKKITLTNMASYFGPLDLIVKSHLAEGFIEAQITCPAEFHPASVNIRLPHPEGRKAVRIIGGEYLSSSESVQINNFNGHGKVWLYF